jgi:hypothetical protein
MIENIVLRFDRRFALCHAFGCECRAGVMEAGRGGCKQDSAAAQRQERHRWSPCDVKRGEHLAKVGALVRAVHKAAEAATRTYSRHRRLDGPKGSWFMLRFEGKSIRHDGHLILSMTHVGLAANDGPSSAFHGEESGESLGRRLPASCTHGGPAG